MKLLEKIDIHVHTSESGWLARLPVGTARNRYATPEELMEIYKKIHVERGVLQPSLNAEDGFQISSNYEIKCICDRYPQHFSWFCNIDPRQGYNSPDTDFTPYIEVCKENGAKGVGEMCFNLPFDHPMVVNLFRHCEKNDMPVIFHIGLLNCADYGVVDSFGLPLLEKTLGAFPHLRLLGHSQKFWSHISGDVTEDTWTGYPQGPVTKGGRVVELLRKYPNLNCDLSAGSGFNAVSRDPEFGYAFLEEFQDRLYFGTDICSPLDVPNPDNTLSAFLDRAVMNGKISYTAYEKICRGNAELLLSGRLPRL